MRRDGDKAYGEDLPVAGVRMGTGLSPLVSLSIDIEQTLVGDSVLGLS